MVSRTEFFNIQPVNAALKSLFLHWTPQSETENIQVTGAFGRVLASPIASLIDLPEFRRSSVDGYAIRAADTFGASQSLPVYLNCISTVPMGAEANFSISPGQAALIPTGAMLPQDADAVVMVEHTQQLVENEIEVLRPIAPGENVIQRGEDVGQGEVILSAGHRLRPQDIGALLGVGILAVDVIQPPHVGILSSGDEIVPPHEKPGPGQIRDINAYTLAALVQEAGAIPIFLGISRDEIEDFAAKAQAGFQTVDILIITAGSSVGTRDLTREVIAALGKPGILQHGLAVKPGKPTILALCDNKPVIGLPGNPVSALLVARQIILPLIERLFSLPPKSLAVVKAILTSNIPSITGREDTVPVRLFERNGNLLAEPIFGKSNLIYTLVKADGLVSIPLNSTGLKAETLVDVTLF